MISKYTITAPKSIIDAAEKRSDPTDGGRSLAISRSLERYFAIVERSRSEMREKFTDAECGLILDANNGVAYMDTVSIQFLPHGVDDAIQMDRLDEKWGIEAGELMEKLNATSYADRVAIVDAIQLWWLRQSAGEKIEYGQLFEPLRSGGLAV